MKKDVQALVLVLLGGAVLRISIDGTYLRYLKPGMLVFLLASGAFLLALGLASAWYDGLLRQPASSAAVMAQGPNDSIHEHDVDDGHGHRPGGPRVAWLLMLPVLGVFLVAPPALGAYAADRGSVAPKPSEALPGLPAGDVVAVPVSEYVTRAVWDGGRTLQDRTVELTGFAVPRDDGGWDLARLALTCCAADAIAAKVQLKDVSIPLATDQWLRITGRWVEGGGVEDPTAVPVIEVSEAEPIQAPEQTYE